jgi:DNA-directed RNA polymerase beta' subunit
LFREKSIVKVYESLTVKLANQSGPVKNWECFCEKYKRIRIKGLICERCGVEINKSRVRSHIMGYINLAPFCCSSE